MSRVHDPLDVATELRIGPWRVDSGLKEVARGDERVHLGPRVMELLLYLAGRHGAVVSKHELARNVWKGAFVSDDAVLSRP